MPNKRNKNNKFKFRKLTVKKGLATVLASTLGISSGAALVTLNSGQNVEAAGLRYFNDSSFENQTRIMMNGDNFIDTNCWMNVELAADPNNTGKYTSTLKFSIPGYDMSNLKFFVMPKNPEIGGDSITEYELASSLTDPVPSVYVPNMSQGAYKVHVYNGSLAPENFVCKAEWIVTDGTFDTTNAITKNLVNSAGAPTAYVTKVAKSATDGVTNMYSLSLDTSVIPFSAGTVKCVFFKAGQSPDIDQTLYDYVYLSGSTLVYIIEADASSNTTYEAHFYKDEVKEGNFICKAVDIKLSSSS